MIITIILYSRIKSSIISRKSNISIPYYFDRQDISQKSTGQNKAGVKPPVAREKDTRPAAGIRTGRRDKVNPISKLY